MRRAESLQRTADALDTIIGEWAASRHPDEIIETLSAAGVITGPINTVAEVVDDPQLRARGMLVEHFDEGAQRSVLGPGIVPVLSESPGGIRSTGPARPGLHNSEVYTGLLGRTAAELESLRAQRVL